MATVTRAYNVVYYLQYSTYMYAVIPRAVMAEKSVFGQNVGKAGNVGCDMREHDLTRLSPF